jgi:hypothetical protein
MSDRGIEDVPPPPPYELKAPPDYDNYDKSEAPEPDPDDVEHR